RLLGSGGLGQHGDRIAGGDPDRADIRGQKLGSEEWLEDGAGWLLADEGEVEVLPPPEVIGDAAASDADVAAQRAERVEGSHDGAAVHAPGHPPPDHDRGWTFVQPRGDVARDVGADVRFLAPCVELARERQRMEVWKMIAVRPCRRIDPFLFEEHPRHRHRQREIAPRPWLY